jgi:hypothetical protein
VVFESTIIGWESTGFEVVVLLWGLQVESIWLEGEVSFVWVEHSIEDASLVVGVLMLSVVALHNLLVHVLIVIA